MTVRILKTFIRRALHVPQPCDGFPVLTILERAK
jgi:hypothetical protein